MNLKTKIEELIAKEWGLSMDEVIIEDHSISDRQYSPNGWQYKKYGNSTKGDELLSKLKNEAKDFTHIPIENRNDHNFSANEEYIAIFDDMIVFVKQSGSRSGASQHYTFQTVTKIKRMKNGRI